MALAPCRAGGPVATGVGATGECDLVRAEALQPKGVAASKAGAPPTTTVGVAGECDLVRSEALEPRRGAQEDDITAAIFKNILARKAVKGADPVQGKGKGKGDQSKARKVVKDGTRPAMPKLEKQPPIRYLSCSIYTDCTAQCWRAVEKSARRVDFKRTWSGGAAAWGQLLQWCEKASAGARS